MSKTLEINYGVSVLIGDAWEKIGVKEMPEKEYAAESKANDAIEFAEWLRIEKYPFDDEKKVYIAVWNNYQELTIEELYKIFSESQPKK